MHRVFCSGDISAILDRIWQTAGIKFTHRPKIRFFAPQGRVVAPIHVKLGMLTGTWVRLSVQNFTSIGAGGGNAAPKISKIPLFVRVVGANPLTDFRHF